MRVKTYTDLQHFKQLRAWLKHRGINLTSPEMLSDFGLVVDGIAIGFLFKTNSKQCWIENMAADPTANPAARSEALNVLFGALEDEARRCGYQVVHAASAVPALKTRLEALNYSPYVSTPFYKRID